jgi:hypothetical protein
LHSFRYCEGQLHCEAIDLATVAEQYGTPLYVYNATTIVDHYRRLAAGLKDLDHLICYAVKANSNRAILRLLRDELNTDVHGEVDEASWRWKQTLRRSKSAANNRNFGKYARQSFIDTLTLYLHGICCDIDVDTGPRQLPSRYLRKRLLLLEE